MMTDREIDVLNKACQMTGTDTVDKTSDPARTHASDGLGYCVLGAMKPLLGSKYKVRSPSTITVR